MYVASSLKDTGLDLNGKKEVVFKILLKIHSMYTLTILFIRKT